MVSGVSDPGGLDGKWHLWPRDAYCLVAFVA
jgi:hypothetical protein